MFISTAIFSMIFLLGRSLAQAPKTECTQSGNVLLCRAQLPDMEDLQAMELQMLMMYQLPEGTWLSVDDPKFTGTGIQKIEIQNSDISRIDPGYLAKISGKNKLKRLMLRNVRGPIVVDRDMVQGLEKSLNYLVVVSSLSVKIADLTTLAGLTDLELYGTKVIGTPTDFEKLLPQLRSLDIRNCNLNQLPWEAVAEWISTDDSRRLKINDNQWKCDCSMAVLKRLQPGVVESSSVNFASQSDLKKLVCASPPALKNRMLSDISEEELCPSDVGPEPGVEGKMISPSEEGSDGIRTGVIEDAGNLGPSSGEKTGSEGSGEGEVSNGGLRKEVIIASVVVGILVLGFIIFIVVYKCRLYPKKKSQEERTSKTHQNKRYVNVIEEPPLQQFDSDNPKSIPGNGSQV